MKPFFRRDLILQSCRTVLAACLMAGLSTIAFAHPQDGHLPPLTASEVERSVRALEILVPKWSGQAMPDNAETLGALAGVLEDALSASDGITSSQSPTLLRALRQAGYPDSPYIVDQWKLDTERVLETYADMRDDDGSKAMVVVMTPFMDRLDSVVGKLL